MNLTKSTLVKISATDSTWLFGRGNKKFIPHLDEGAIHISRHPNLEDTVIHIYAISRPEEDITEEKLAELSNYRNLRIVLPYYIYSPEIFSLLTKIESRWGQNAKPKDENDPKQFLRENLVIDMVADVGKDMSTGKTQYASYQFDGLRFIEGIIEQTFELKSQQETFDPYSLSIGKMKIAMKAALKLFLKNNKGKTLQKINEYISIAKSTPFEELTSRQQARIMETILDSIKNGLKFNEVKSLVFTKHHIGYSVILEKLIINTEKILRDYYK
jgi:hypothetical protein